MSPFAISGLLAGISSIVFGFIVLIKSANKKLGRIWFIFTLSVALWEFGILWYSTAKSPEIALLADRSAYAFGVVWIATLFQHFVCTFLEVKPPRFLAINYLISLVFLSIIPTSFFFSSVRWVFGSMFYGEAGILFPLFFIWWMALVFFSHCQLIRAYKNVSSEKRNQIKYFFLATAIGFTGGSLAYLPNFGIDVYPWGNFAVCLYPFIMAYAIVKHQLMDIYVVLRKSVVYSVMISILTVIYLIGVTEGAHVLQKVFGASPLTISVVTACLVTAIFLPLWNRVQNFVDRYFFRDWVQQGEIVREVAAGFSHELKSPLAGLSMQAQLTLAELEDVEKGKRSLQEVLPKIKEDLHYLVNKAMDAARRIEAVRGVAEPGRGAVESVRIPDIIESALSMLDSLLDQRLVSVRREIPATVPAVCGDAKQLEIVFINLMKNALQAMSMNGTTEQKNRGSVLTLSSQQRDGSVLISVKDTGPGISARDLPRIFEANFTTKGSKGTGMGLFLSHQIIKAHGGSIEVKSEEGKGTEFIVRLPKHSSESRTGVHEAA